MQIGRTLSAKNLHPFQTRRTSVKCQASPLNINPATITLPASQKPGDSTELTRKHVANLEKLLQKTNSPDPRKAIDNNGSPDQQESKRRGLLEGLSPTRIWPEMKAAEETSSRHFNRRQLLLSMTAEYSPRNSLRSRWREYHGSNDWIDPLDENLQREVIRYGMVVQAAYHAFHSDLAMSAEEAKQLRYVALPDRSYKVTRSLYATASVGLPK